MCNDDAHGVPARELRWLMRTTWEVHLISVVSAWLLQIQKYGIKVIKNLIRRIRRIRVVISDDAPTIQDIGTEPVGLFPPSVLLLSAPTRENYI